MSNQRVVVLTDEQPGAELEKVQTELADWIGAGAQPWELPAVAAHFVLSCYGLEAVPVGTHDALQAVSDECEECCGEGEFRDESYPGTSSTDCDHCKGHGRVPKPVEHPEGITDDQVEQGGKALYDRWVQTTTFFRGWDELADEFRAEARTVLEALLFPGGGER